MRYELSPGQVHLIDLKPWMLQSNDDTEPHTEFTRYTYEARQQGRHPTVFSYHGFMLPTKYVDVHYVAFGKQHAKCFVTFVEYTYDVQTDQVFMVPRYTVPAWQGNNDLLHLLQVCPGETDREFNLHEVLTNSGSRGRYTGVVDRMRAFYSDEDLVSICPEVFYFQDPAIDGEKVAVEADKTPIETLAAEAQLLESALSR
ncbi:MAG: hypothetical protein SFU83_08395 [Meiothermus sp.]|nr:hypothetical protein [Meiothermus sp.]